MYHNQNNKKEGGRKLNKNKIVEYKDTGKKIVYFVGRLTKDIPFLVETKKGKMMTPFLYGNDDDGYSSLIGEKYLKIEKNKKIYIDVENYRRKRQDTVEAIAEKTLENQA